MQLTSRTTLPGDSKWTASPIAGPDVICGDINGIQTWGGLAGQASYSLGTTSCNIGTAQLLWQQFTQFHPVMPQNIYRIKTVNGASRIEQIGQSWLKHGFCALQQTLCGACTPAGGGCASALGIGCSDPYTAARNGTQTNLGPRYDINASTGVFNIIPTNPPTPGSPITTTPGGILAKRIIVNNTDLDPALNPGAEYWGECQYVHQQDAASDNNDNNGSGDEPSGGAIEPIEIQEEMERSFLDYAMSVIVARALPDVRDGLKPVHRRILWDMEDNGFRPDRPYVKCAKVSGDTMGRFHPHGDGAIYDALVRMAQPFSLRHPLRRRAAVAEREPDPVDLEHAIARTAREGEARMLDRRGAVLAPEARVLEAAER